MIVILTQQKEFCSEHYHDFMTHASNIHIEIHANGNNDMSSNGEERGIFC